MDGFKPFTLFLCLIVLAFMLYGHVLIQNWVEYQNNLGKPLEEGWEGVITLWDFPKPIPGGGSGFAWIREKIREFEKKNPGIFIELHCLDRQNGQIQLDLAVQSGRYPDIAPLQSNFWYADKGVLEPLDQYFAGEIREEYFDYALEAVSYRGRIWGMPLYGTAPVMLLNLELFEEMGVEPPEGGRWTYQQFVETLEKLTCDRDGDGNIDIYGFNSPIFNGYYNTWGIIFSDGWQLWDPYSHRYSIYTPEAVSGLEKLVDLSLKYRVVPENFGLCSPKEGWKSFALEKRVAVYPAELRAVSELEKQKSTGKGFEFGIAEYPAGRLGRPVTVGSGVEAYCIFKQQDRGKKEMCLEFLEFIAQDYRGQKAAERGVLPVQRKAGSSCEFTVNPENIVVIPKRDKWAYIEDVINNHIRQAVMGQESPAEALKAAQQEVDMVQGSN